MDTLRRVGSIRKSLRKKAAAPDPPPQLSLHDVELDAVSQGSTEAEVHPAYFTLTCTDAIVTAASATYLPSSLKLVINRHRKTFTSSVVPWEPSLKNHLTGTGVWHPPFVKTVSISPPMRSKSKGTLKHKDVFITLESVNKKGNAKLLAKVRVNLSDYYVAASVSPVAFKLKLYPESSKISSAFVHIAIHRTEADPESQKPTIDNQTEADNVVDLLQVPIRSSPSRISAGSESEDDYVEGPIPRPASLFLPIANNNQVKREEKTTPEIAINHAVDQDVKIESKSDAGKLALAEPESSDIDDTPLKSFPPVVPPPLPARGGKHVSPRPSVVLVQTELDAESCLSLSPPQEKSFEPPEEEKNVEPKPSSPVAEPIFKIPAPKQKTVSDDDSDEEDNGLRPPISLGFVCPSPKLTPHKQSSEEKDLLDWAKKLLSSYGHIKVTNLSSSWRNGLGFLALLHTRYPDVVPMSSIKMNNQKDNCEMALNIGELLGVDLSLNASDLGDKPAVMTVLREWKQLLFTDNLVQIPNDQLLEFRKVWFKRCGYFADQVAAIIEAEEKQEVETQNSQAMAAEEEVQPVEEVGQAEEIRPNRDRVRAMLAEAHKQASESSFDNDELGGRLIESKTISEEMSKLTQEEERISKEKDRLEQILRNENISHKAMEAAMQSWVQLVNEKNSLVRRQMQLNIAEQEKVITHEVERIQWRLQKFAEIEDDQKTEAMRQEESALIEKLLEAVQKKNELVLILDAQEKAIAEDERIQKLVESKDLVSLKKDEECSIM